MAQPVHLMDRDTGIALRLGLLNAIVLADSKGDRVQAAKILRGALRCADRSDPAVSEARDFLAEFDELTSPAQRS